MTFWLHPLRSATSADEAISCLRLRRGPEGPLYHGTIALEQL
jgi:hypothetical protein